MIGTAVGFVCKFCLMLPQQIRLMSGGGWSGDNLGILSPFEIAVALTLLSLVFALAFIKSTPLGLDNAIVTKPGSNSKGFLGPLKVFLPRKQGSGRYYGLSVMGCGIFVGVVSWLPLLAGTVLKCSSQPASTRFCCKCTAPMRSPSHRQRYPERSAFSHSR